MWSESRVVDNGMLSPRRSVNLTSTSIVNSLTGKPYIEFVNKCDKESVFPVYVEDVDLRESYYEEVDRTNGSVQMSDCQVLAFDHSFSEDSGRFGNAQGILAPKFWSSVGGEQCFSNISEPGKVSCQSSMGFKQSNIVNSVTGEPYIEFVNNDVRKKDAVSPVYVEDTDSPENNDGSEEGKQTSANCQMFDKLSSSNPEVSKNPCRGVNSQRLLTPEIWDDSLREQSLFLTNSKLREALSRYNSFAFWAEPLLQLGVGLCSGMSEKYTSLIDTGSDVNMVRCSVVNKNNISVNATGGAEIRGFGDKNIHHSKGNVIVGLYLESTPMLPVVFEVVEDDTIKHDFVLGLDFFQTNNMSVNVAKRRIRRTLPNDLIWDLYLSGNASEPNQVIQGYAAKSVSALVLAATLGNQEVDPFEEDESLPEEWTYEKICTDIELHRELDVHQKNAVRGVLNLCLPVLSRSDTDVGKASVTAHRIELYEQTPIFQRPRRFPDPVADEIEKQCREMAEADIIEPSKSPWSSPVVPVTKKDGSLRLCVDYRKVNAVTKPDRFPTPNLTEAVYNLHGVQFFTVLDLVKGYYQMPIEEGSREYTAFSTTRSHWQFKRLAFGLKNAPSAFQREMQIVLSKFPRKNVLVYIDDILIMDTTFAGHLALVEQVLKTLIEHGIKIKPSKCVWFQPEVKYLGHVVSREGLAKPREYVDKVHQFPRPQTVRELQEFLGLVNFQRKFVRDCSAISKPLSELTGGRQSQKLVWSPEMEESFAKLKELIREEITLAFPDYSSGAELLQLYVDTSATGAGACLLQNQGGVDRIIALNSLTFSKAQQNYSVIERELAAMRWGLKTFQGFLFGNRFLLYTDHLPLLYLHNMQATNSRLVRTSQELAEYDYEIHYRPGRCNQAADALSRLRPHLAPDGGEQSTFADPTYLPDGLRVLSLTPGGGDSLFISLLAGLEHLNTSADAGFMAPETPLRLRQKIAEEMQKLPDKYGVKADRVQRNHLKMMRQPGILPFEECILAFSKLFRCQVWVHYGSDKPIIFDMPKNPISEASKRIHLQCVSGIHYNPVMELSTYFEQNPTLKKTHLQFCTEKETVKMPAGQSSAISDKGLPLEKVRPKLVASVGVCRPISPGCSHKPWGMSSTSVVIDERIIVEGAVQRVYCGLLDSGAQVSLVSEGVLNDLCEAVRVPEDCDPCTLYGIGKDAVVRTARVVKLNLSIGNEYQKLLSSPFIVVPRNIMPYCFILGGDFLHLHQVELDFSRGVVEFVSQGGLESVQMGLRDAGAGRVEGPLVGCLRLGGDDGTSSILRESERGVADSSLMSGADRSMTADPVVSPLLDHDAMVKLQTDDWLITRLKNCIKRNSERLPKCLQRYSRHYCDLSIKDEILWHKTDHRVPVVSFHFAVGLIITLHNEMCHLGRQKTLSLAGKHVWHPSLFKIAQDVCRSCAQCQYLKIDHQVAGPPVIKIQAQSPFDLVAVDIVKFPKTSRGFVGCLVLTDHNSKWTSAVPIRSLESVVVARAMERQILPFLTRCPLRVLSDNGKEFVSAEFTNMLQQYNIVPLRTTPYKPSCNGLVERMNRTLGELLRNLKAQHDWDLKLPRAIIVYNSTYHSSLGMSPTEYLMTKQHRIESNPAVPIEAVQHWKVGHPNFSPYKVGEKVKRKMNHRGNLLLNKFEPRYDGPYRVTRVQKGGFSYDILGLSGAYLGKTLRCHHTQLLLWCEVPLYIRTHPAYNNSSEIEVPGAAELLDGGECSSELSMDSTLASSCVSSEFSVLSSGSSESVWSWDDNASGHSCDLSNATTWSGVVSSDEVESFHGFAARGVPQAGSDFLGDSLLSDGGLNAIVEGASGSVCSESVRLETGLSCHIVGPELQDELCGSSWKSLGGFVASADGSFTGSEDSFRGFYPAAPVNGGAALKPILDRENTAVMPYTAKGGLFSDSSEWEDSFLGFYPGPAAVDGNKPSVSVALSMGDECLSGVSKVSPGAFDLYVSGGQVAESGDLFVDGCSTSVGLRKKLQVPAAIRPHTYGESLVGSDEESYFFESSDTSLGTELEGESCLLADQEDSVDLSCGMVDVLSPVQLFSDHSDSDRGSSGGLAMGCKIDEELLSSGVEIPPGLFDWGTDGAVCGRSFDEFPDDISSVLDCHLEEVSEYMGKSPQKSGDCAKSATQETTMSEECYHSLDEHSLNSVSFKSVTSSRSDFLGFGTGGLLSNGIVITRGGETGSLTKGDVGIEELVAGLGSDAAAESESTLVATSQSALDPLGDLLQSSKEELHVITVVQDEPGVLSIDRNTEACSRVSLGKSYLATRSRGEVKDQPWVQGKPIEYAKKSKKQ